MEDGEHALVPPVGDAGSPDTNSRKKRTILVKKNQTGWPILFLGCMIISQCRFAVDPVPGGDLVIKHKKQIIVARKPRPGDRLDTSGASTVSALPFAMV